MAEGQTDRGQVLVEQHVDVNALAGIDQDADGLLEEEPLDPQERRLFPPEPRQFPAFRARQVVVQPILESPDRRRQAAVGFALRSARHPFVRGPPDRSRTTATPDHSRFCCSITTCPQSLQTVSQSLWSPRSLQAGQGGVAPAGARRLSG